MLRSQLDIVVVVLEQTPSRKAIAYGTIYILATMGNAAMGI